MMHDNASVSAEDALKKLKEGNCRFVCTDSYSGDVSLERRKSCAQHGQHPYAVVVTCSDSRVIPEIIFNADIGSIFIIRSAGNVVDGCTLGSIEYAVGHMGCKLVVVMGHTSCGAIAEAIKGFHEGHSIEIIEDICQGIGCEKDPLKASCLNIENSVRLITEDIGERHDVKVIGALYSIDTGEVSFLD